MQGEDLRPYSRWRGGVFVSGFWAALWQQGVNVVRYPVRNYTRWGLYPQAVIILGCLFWFQLWPIIPTVAIGFLGVVAVIMTVRADHFSRSEKIVWVFIAFALFAVEMHSIYKDRDEHDRQQVETTTRQENSFKEIASGIQGSIADSDRNFAATMGKTNQVLENITGGKSFAIVIPQVWSGLVPIPVSIRNYGKQTLTGVTVTIYSRKNFDMTNPRSFYETEAINVGTLHAGELRLLKETLTPVVGTMKGKDGLPVDSFQLDIAAQNFTAKEYLFFKKGTRIPWVFKYTVTRQFVKSKQGDTTFFGYETLADKKEWLGEKSK